MNFLHYLLYGAGAIILIICAYLTWFRPEILKRYKSFFFFFFLSILVSKRLFDEKKWILLLVIGVILVLIAFWEHRNYRNGIKK